MAVPKRKTSRWRRDNRRAQNFFSKVKLSSLVSCPNCGELTIPHRVCPYCGYYKGREVIKVS
ncbi:ribosomal protein L32 [Hydrogenobacter thermophilus TK-6]|uniref:Large ribosomal subunit protein bL32 n=1 Tax=Hydrogenobacter thermophilus (strain DSM 6534 / IAM 12695 / TK-6) TaxID=608538 RepID=D3DHF9_HYDTT|nr:50S ribosomal protein L32 [Hydrogenobacter thermophilus]ADO45198.1 ribosomal protein L32 [Hydrogenobacter thermophilus TK-6]BAI69261.1 ribosomal protein L32 [Hydrogenobacter thermophilus TK-6]